MTFIYSSVIVLLKGGENIYVLILISILLSKNLVSYYYIKKKSFLIYKTKNKKTFNKLFPTLKEKLKCKINLKYLFLFLIFILSFRYSKKLFFLIIFFIVYFCIQNIINNLRIFIEEQIVKKEISNIVQVIIFSLFLNLPFRDILIRSIEIIKYKPFKKEYEKFIKAVLLNRIDRNKISTNLRQRFKNNKLDILLEVIYKLERN